MSHRTITRPVTVFLPLLAAKGEFADDIFTSVDGAPRCAQPVCATTWRNGKKLGDDTNAVGD